MKHFRFVETTFKRRGIAGFGFKKGKLVFTLALTPTLSPGEGGPL
jgi:hypothetical protein